MGNFNCKKLEKKGGGRKERQLQNNNNNWRMHSHTFQT